MPGGRDIRYVLREVHQALRYRAHGHDEVQQPLFAARLSLMVGNDERRNRARLAMDADVADHPHPRRRPLNVCKRGRSLRLSKSPRLHRQPPFHSSPPASACLATSITNVARRR